MSELTDPGIRTNVTALAGVARADAIGVTPGDRLHTAFNQFPSQPMLAMLVTSLLAPLTLMAILRFGTGEARQWLEAESDLGEEAVLERIVPNERVEWTSTSDSLPA